jgi:hypothetical protein
MLEKVKGITSSGIMVFIGNFQDWMMQYAFVEFV